VTLTIRPLTGEGSPPAEGEYAQACEVSGVTRWLYLSGQIPVGPDGALASDFTGQCDQVWDNLETQLRAAGMTLANLVKVTTYLSDRAYALENREVRIRRTAGRQTALTVIVTDLFEPEWLVEIEAVAVA
jgi:2-iminobutanoate/2-iminopropanoate deaminase